MALAIVAHMESQPVTRADEYGAKSLRFVQSRLARSCPGHVGLSTWMTRLSIMGLVLAP